MQPGLLMRYTNLPSLVSILKERQLTLMDPMEWEDRNDTYYLRKYKDRKGAASLMALCFTNTSETSHHWKTFAAGTDGVCIKIHRDPFVSYLNGLNVDGQILHGEVTYKSIEEVESGDFVVEQLPFLKRYPFRHEYEYRVIFVSEKDINSKKFDMPLDLTLIKEISLSNALPEALSTNLVALLRSIDGCGNLKIFRSTLNDNLRWRRASDRAI